MNQEVLYFKYSHTQRKKPRAGANSVNSCLSSQVGHCLLEKVEEEPDCPGQVGNGSKERMVTSCLLLPPQSE